MQVPGRRIAHTAKLRNDRIKFKVPQKLTEASHPFTCWIYAATPIADEWKGPAKNNLR